MSKKMLAMISAGMVLVFLTIILIYPTIFHSEKTPIEPTPPVAPAPGAEIK